MKLKVLEANDHPCLVSFPQGIPASVDDLTVLAGKKSRDKSEKIMVSAQLDDLPTLAFKGSNFGDASKSKDCFKFAIGMARSSRPGTISPCCVPRVGLERFPSSCTLASAALTLHLHLSAPLVVCSLCRKTNARLDIVHECAGVMELLPTDHVYVLRPNIQRLSEMGDGKLAARLSTATASERRESLTNEFGSKKKKRALQAMKSNIISAENISAANELGGQFTAKSPEANAEIVEAAKQALANGKKRKRR